MLSSDACVDAICIALVDLHVPHKRIIELCGVGTDRFYRTLRAGGYCLQKGQRRYPHQTEVRELYLMGLLPGQIAEIMTAHYGKISRNGVYKVLARTGTALDEQVNKRAETIVRLYALGRTVRDIQLQCRCNKSTIYLYLDRAGVARRQPRNHGPHGRDHSHLASTSPEGTPTNGR